MVARLDLVRFDGSAPVVSLSRRGHGIRPQQRDYDGTVRAESCLCQCPINNTGSVWPVCLVPTLSRIPRQRPYWIEKITGDVEAQGDTGVSGQRAVGAAGQVRTGEQCTSSYVVVNRRCKVKYLRRRGQATEPDGSANFGRQQARDGALAGSWPGWCEPGLRPQRRRWMAGGQDLVGSILVAARAGASNAKMALLLFTRVVPASVG